MSHSNLKEAFYAEGKLPDCPVYDLHAHMGPYYGIGFPRPDADGMIHAMDRAGVRLLVFCHHGTLFTPDIGNWANIAAVQRYPARLRAYCGINPNYPEVIAYDIAHFDEHPDVFVGLKMLADYHGFALTDQRYRAAWELADRRKLLVLIHTWGGSRLDGPEVVREIAERYPQASILMGHSCHGEWDKAIALVREFPNLYFELCAVLDERGMLERFVGEMGSRRILFGTDLPWFNHHYYIGSVLGADITDEDRHDILHRNAEALLSRFGV
ncbi:MAG: amidohydrolase family protein [Chloroflexi bacterium]|nr:amidohydrolase family protein [Chloroflexota bacterium]MCL5273561.1 amidohydrolase family protein [Chloroflexota bacterium]